MWSQKPPEALLDIINFEVFLEEHASRPPGLSMLTLAMISPSDEKSPVNLP